MRIMCSVGVGDQRDYVVRILLERLNEPREHSLVLSSALLGLQKLGRLF